MIDESMLWVFLGVLMSMERPHRTSPQLTRASQPHRGLR